MDFPVFPWFSHAFPMGNPLRPASRDLAGAGAASPGQEAGGQDPRHADAGGGRSPGTAVEMVVWSGETTGLALGKLWENGG